MIIYIDKKHINLTNKTKTMKTIILLLSLFVSTTCFAKTKYKQVGNVFIVETTKTEKAKKTSYSYQVGDSIYPIYLSSKGRAYILKTSKKTSKPYKYYIPKEIQSQIIDKQ